jgi:hypothetical protein
MILHTGVFLQENLQSPPQVSRCHTRHKQQLDSHGGRCKPRCIAAARQAPELGRLSALFSMQNVGKRFDPTTVLHGISLDRARSEVVVSICMAFQSLNLFPRMSAVIASAVSDGRANRRQTAERISSHGPPPKISRGPRQPREVVPKIFGLNGGKVSYIWQLPTRQLSTSSAVR